MDLINCSVVSSNKKKQERRDFAPWSQDYKLAIYNLAISILAILATCNFGNLQLWQLSILTTFSFDNFQFWLFNKQNFWMGSNKNNISIVWILRSKINEPNFRWKKNLVKFQNMDAAIWEVFTGMKFQVHIEIPFFKVYVVKFIYWQFGR